MKTILAAALILTPTLAEAQSADRARTAAQERDPVGQASPLAGLLGQGDMQQSPLAGLLGQAGGLLGGGGLPQIGSIDAGNAAGLLGYCLKNRLLGSGATGAGGAASVLGRLTGQRGVQRTPGYAAGQAGQLETPNGDALSLDGLRGQLKTQLCNLVLKRAKAFL